MSIEKEGQRNWALRDNIEIRAEGQDYDGALQAALPGTCEDSLTDYTFGQIAVRQETMETLKKAMDTRAKIQSDDSQNSAFVSVAVAAGEAGQITALLRLTHVQLCGGKGRNA